jgi:SH3-like domain-containing protein
MKILKALISIWATILAFPILLGWIILKKINERSKARRKKKLNCFSCKKLRTANSYTSCGKPYNVDFACTSRGFQFKTIAHFNEYNRIKDIPFIPEWCPGKQTASGEDTEL